MIKPEVPINEKERLAELEKYNILDTLSEKEYDDITFLAAVICKTPISLITFVDENRQWFKSRRGLTVQETKKEYAFCAHALNTPEEILIVPDSRKDKKFEDNPLVTGEPHVIFYTGIPLLTVNGHALGTLCVIDHKPRELSPEQLDALKILSKQVINLLEMRKATIALQKMQAELESRNKELEQFASVVAHDIKSPLTNILLANEIFTSDHSDALGQTGNQLINISNKSVNKIKNLVDGILAYYKSNAVLDEVEKIDLPDFFESIISMLPHVKKSEIAFSRDKHFIYMNKTQLEQVFFNLLNNSAKYNDKEILKIKITFSQDEKFYNFSISDNGIGIAKEDQDKIFILFTRLAADNKYGKDAYGIGLSTVKKIVEKYQGAIKVNSVLGEGATFTFSIKKPTADA